MSDSTLNRFLAQGDDAAEGAFTPDPPTPASGPDALQLFLNIENPAAPVLKYWDGDSFESAVVGGAGTVTNTGTLTDHALIVGNGGVDVSALGSLGTTTTVLHGNAAADPAFSAVVEADITLADNTTNDVTSTKHGLAQKSPADATKFLNGGATPAWTAPLMQNTLLFSQKRQCFTLFMVNTAGTLQHKFVASVDATVLPNSGLIDKITGPSATLANTPTVSNVVDFTNGFGITSNRMVFNTAAQTVADYAGDARIIYYDGNVLIANVRCEITSRDVNGTTRLRLELVFNGALAGGAWTINTTNIPSGKQLAIVFNGYLA